MPSWSLRALTSGTFGRVIGKKRSEEWTASRLDESHSAPRRAPRDRQARLFDSEATLESVVGRLLAYLTRPHSSSAVPVPVPVPDSPTGSVELVCVESPSASSIQFPMSVALPCCDFYVWRESCAFFFHLGFVSIFRGSLFDRECQYIV